AVAGAGVMIVLGLASIALTRAGWRGDSPEEDEVEQAPSDPADAEVPESPALGGVERAEATPRSGAASLLSALPGARPGVAPDLRRDPPLLLRGGALGRPAAAIKAPG